VGGGCCFTAANELQSVKSPQGQRLAHKTPTSAELELNPPKNKRP